MLTLINIWFIFFLKSLSTLFFGTPGTNTFQQVSHFLKKKKRCLEFSLYDVESLNCNIIYSISTMQQCRMSVLDTLTPDDIRVLVETEDENSRRGGFERVFPSPISNKYHRFFESARYNNVLVDEWVKRYHRMPSKGKL